MHRESQIKFNPFPVQLYEISVKSNFTENMSESFGEWLKQKRRSAGLTQEDLAKRIGATKSTISLYEKDKIAQPRLHQLDSIGRVLGIDVKTIRKEFTDRNVTSSQTSPPTNYVELLQALEKLGITIMWAELGDLESYTEEDYQNLLERIKYDTDFSVTRRK
jgi:transcriptional regulator with XRE-family HTH domain